MPDIYITVRGKIAQIQAKAKIVCGNSDYTAVFDFDSEWDLYEQKTARFVWRDMRSGENRYYDTLFSGSAVQIPAVYNTDMLLIGVYAGDIRTTTPAHITCRGCITDGRPLHDDPPPDVYNQLMALLAGQSGNVDAVGNASAAADGAMRYIIGIAEKGELE